MKVNSPAAEYIPVSGMIVVPSLLNQRWWSWVTGSVAVNSVQLLGVHDENAGIDSAGYGGSSNLTYVNTFGATPYAGGFAGHAAGSTSVTVAARAGVRPQSTTIGYARRDWNPTLDVMMATGTPSDPAMGYRYWIGLFNTAAALVQGTDTAPATNFAAFRFSSTAGDVNWMACVRDGAATQAVSTGVPVAVETKYHLRIRFTATGVTFSVNDGNNVLITTGLPVAATQLWRQGSAQKDATALGQILPWYSALYMVRLGNPTRLR